MRKIITIAVAISIGFFMHTIIFKSMWKTVNVHAESTHEGHMEEDSRHDEHDDKEKIIKMDYANMKEFGIELDTVAPGALNTYITLPGEIVVNPDTLAHIVPRLQGIVRDVRKTLGDSVRKGEIIAVLESVALGKAKIEYLTIKKQLEIIHLDLKRVQLIHDNTARMLNLLKTFPDTEVLQKKIGGLDMGDNRSRLISTYTNLILTRETHNREKNLYAKKISSHADFLKAKRDYKSAEASYSATYDEITFEIKRQLLDTSRAVSIAESKVHASERSLQILGLTDNDIRGIHATKRNDNKLARVEMRAPFSGTVIEKHITLGEMLKDDSKTFVIADLTSVWANLNVYQKDLTFIRKGQTVIIRSGHGIVDVSGVISWVSPLVGEETRTAVARVILPNKDGLLLPGLFINGKVAIDGHKTTQLVIHKSAIQTINGKLSVFLRTEEGFESQSIITGQENENEIEIISGLKQGQKYVVKGAFTLKAQLAKGSFGDGHNH